MPAPVALVTGASRGIGKQLASDLAAAGFDVVCAARSSEDAPSKLPGTIDATAELVRQHGRQAMAVPLDVRDEEAVKSAMLRLRDWCAANRVEVMAEAPSEVAGADGNQEIFVHLRPVAG